MSTSCAFEDDDEEITNDKVKARINLFCLNLKDRLKEYSRLLSDERFSSEAGLEIKLCDSRDAAEFISDQNDLKKHRKDFFKVLEMIRQRTKPIPYLAVDLHYENHYTVLASCWLALAECGPAIRTKVFESMHMIDMSTFETCASLSKCIISMAPSLSQIKLILDCSDGNYNCYRGTSCLAGALAQCKEMDYLDLDWLDIKCNRQNQIPKLDQRLAEQHKSVFTILTTKPLLEMTKLTVLKMRLAFSQGVVSEQVLGTFFSKQLPQLKNLDQLALDLFFFDDNKKRKKKRNYDKICQQLVTDLQTGLAANRSCTWLDLKWSGEAEISEPCHIFFRKLLQQGPLLTPHLKHLALQCSDIKGDFDPYRDDFFNIYMVACQSLEHIQLLFHGIHFSLEELQQFPRMFSGQEYYINKDGERCVYQFKKLRALNIYAPSIIGITDSFMNMMLNRESLPEFVAMARHCPRLRQMDCLLGPNAIRAPNTSDIMLERLLERNRLGIPDFLSSDNIIPAPLWSYVLERIVTSCRFDPSRLYEVICAKHADLIPFLTKTTSNKKKKKKNKKKKKKNNNNNNNNNNQEHQQNVEVN